MQAAHAHAAPPSHVDQATSDQGPVGVKTPAPALQPQLLLLGSVGANITRVCWCRLISLVALIKVL